jgi:hypothetical protein
MSTSLAKECPDLQKINNILLLRVEGLDPGIFLDKDDIV